MKYNLLIYDSDIEYCNSLYNYMVNYNSDRYNVVSFTKIDLMIEYCHKSKVDILLTSHDINLSELQDVDILLIVILSDGIISLDKNMYPILNKYQSGDKIVERLNSLLSEVSENSICTFNRNVQGSVIGVYSPIGGSGKTSIALAISKILGEYNDKVLYLNFEQFPSTASYFDCNSNYNLSDLLYFSMENISNFIIKVQAIECKNKDNNIHYFCPQNSLEDIENIEYEHLEDFINRLREIYSYIVIDFPTALNCTTRNLLDICDKVIFVVIPRNDAMTKCDKFIEYTEKSDSCRFNVEDFTVILNQNTNDVSMNDVNIGDLIDFDFIITYDSDMKSGRSSMRRTLYEVTKKVLFVESGDKVV